MKTLFIIIFFSSKLLAISAEDKNRFDEFINTIYGLDSIDGEIEEIYKAKKIAELIDLSRSGDNRATEELGLRYAYEKKYTTAYKWFKKGVENKDIQCLKQLAMMETYGAGCKKDPLKVIHYLMPYMKTGPLDLKYFLQDALTEYLKSFPGKMTTFEEACFAMDVLSKISIAKRVEQGRYRMSYFHKMNRGFMWAWELDNYDKKILLRLRNTIIDKTPLPWK